MGAVYAWSLFRGPFTKQFGWSISEVTLTFTISIFVLGIAAFSATPGSIALGPRPVVLTGGFLYGTGVFLASLSDHKLWWRYLTYSVIGGIGLVFTWKRSAELCSMETVCARLRVLRARGKDPSKCSHLDTHSGFMKPDLLCNPCGIFRDGTRTRELSSDRCAFAVRNDLEAASQLPNPLAHAPDPRQECRRARSTRFKGYPVLCPRPRDGRHRTMFAKCEPSRLDF